MKTEQKIQELKAEWVAQQDIGEPFDLSEIDGFEDHKEELAKYQKDFKERAKAIRFLDASRTQLKGVTYCLKVRVAILNVIEVLDLDEINGNIDDFEHLKSARSWLNTVMDYIGYHERDLEFKKMIAKKVL